MNNIFERNNYFNFEFLKEMNFTQDLLIAACVVRPIIVERGTY